VCTRETLEVTFDGKTDSVFKYAAFEQDMPVESTIVTRTFSDKVQGWSYAVEHDPSLLSLISVTVEGTEADWRVFGPGFVVVDMNGIQACLPGDERCRNPVPGAGYISAVIVESPLLQEGLQLRALVPGRNRLCKATYALRADPGATGTLIQCVDNRLKKTGSPPVSIGFTVDGAFRRPMRLIDGWVRPADAGPGGPGGQGDFLRGDADGNGKINVADVIALIRFVFLRATPGFDCEAAFDLDGDGRVNVVDIAHLISYLFQRGADPPPPFPECGTGSGAPACAESNCAGH
jgi:hypothetical protein